MITVSIDPVIFSIGHLMVRWYGVIVVTAVLLGIWVARHEAERHGLGDYEFGDSVKWVIAAGFAGARLFHVLDHWTDEYAANPLRALYIWEGGLAIWGGVVGGLVALALFARCRRLRLGLLADAVVPGLALAQAIGRLACVITGDAVGKPTGGPFGLAYTNPGAMVPQLGVYYTPSPLYEALMNLVIFAMLWRLRGKALPEGALSLVYLALYSTGRFLVTFWSAYRTVAFGLNQAQLVSLVALAVGLPLLLYRLRQQPHLSGARGQP